MYKYVCATGCCRCTVFSQYDDCVCSQDRTVWPYVGSDLAQAYHYSVCLAAIRKIGCLYCSLKGARLEGLNCRFTRFVR